MTRTSRFIFFTIILAVLIFAGYFFGQQYFTNTNNLRYAITLSNGQIYFGKVVKLNNQEIVLKEVYYAPSKEALSQEIDGKKKIMLRKFGEDTFLTEDRIHINRSTIVYASPLSPDSKINEAITKYEEKQSENTPTPSP